MTNLDSTSVVVQTDKPHDELAGSAWFFSPLAWAVVVVGAACLLLLTVETIPIGAMYWDVFLYLDASNRIADGQIPSVDFSIPAGPLNYWLFYGAHWLFPEAQPLLLATWSNLIVSLPIMTIVVLQVAQSSRLHALALFLPFLFFAMMPINTREYFYFAGFDGFAVYNRGSCMLLYALLAIWMNIRSTRLLAALVGVTMLALFLTKITAFLVGGLFCLFALFCQRIDIPKAVLAAIIAIVPLVVLEITTGIVTAYLGDTVAFVQIGATSMAAKIASAVAQNFRVVLPVFILAVIVVYFRWSEMGPRWRQPLGKSLGQLDAPIAWLVMASGAGILFESQNYGSQSMVYLWPVCLACILCSLTLSTNLLRVCALVLAVCAVAPNGLIVVERSLRASVNAFRYVQLPHENLKSMGMVSVSSSTLDKARILSSVYAEHQESVESIANAGVLTSYALYADSRFQVSYLQHIDDAVDAIRQLEADNKVRFDTVLHLSFTNPFPWLLDRSAPRYVQIGADPSRTVPPPDARTRASLAQTALILEPTCPATASNKWLYKIYEHSISKHHPIRLTPCYRALIHPELIDHLKVPGQG